MKRISIILISLITLLGLKAQECSSLWLSCPEADLGQQVLYSHTYTQPLNMSQASVIIATNGYFRLYVNDNLVSVPSYPLVRAPYRDNFSNTEFLSIKFDVSRYLRNDSNTISVLCSSSNPEDVANFSLRFCGYTHTGQLFSYEADDSWLCRLFDAGMIDYSAELLDGMEPTNISDMQNTEKIMTWLPVSIEQENYLAETKIQEFSAYEYINKVIKPRYFTFDYDLKGISYDFDNGFYGLLRVTLRDTKPGQKIFVAGSVYICKGKDDEQFILRFSASWFRKVYISGDKYFKRSNIERVEGLQVATKSILVP